MAIILPLLLIIANIVALAGILWLLLNQNTLLSVLGIPHETSSDNDNGNNGKENDSVEPFISHRGAGMPMDTECKRNDIQTFGYF